MFCLFDSKIVNDTFERLTPSCSLHCTENTVFCYQYFPRLIPAVPGVCIPWTWDHIFGSKFGLAVRIRLKLPKFI